MKKTQMKQLTVVASVLAALAPAAASAQEMTTTRGFMRDYGGYFLVGGGVTNYLDSSVREHLDTGGTWDLRLGIGNRHFIGGELAYVGSARDAGAFGNSLVTNGAEGVLRVQYPWQQGRWLIEPFAFGGVGWTHFDLNQAQGAIQNTNDLFVMPVGGGVTVAHDHILFDARFTYRQTFDESLIPANDGTAASLKSWAVTASVGYEF